MINAVIFSMDRALQLNLLLESIGRNAKGLFNLSISYRYSNDKFKAGYDKLFSKGWDASTLLQNEHLKDQILGLLKGEYTVFMCDDQMFYRPISGDILKQMDSDVLCFALNLGKNTTHLYNLRCDDTLPEFEEYGEYLKWDWVEARTGRSAFGYPMSLDAHVFRTDKLVELIEKIDFNTPNRLEALLQQFALKQPQHYMVSYRHSAVVNTPVNRVQQEFTKNRASNAPDTSLESLNNAYLNNMVVDFDAMNFDNIIGLHQILELPLKQT